MFIDECTFNVLELRWGAPRSCRKRLEKTDGDEGAELGARCL